MSEFILLSPNGSMIKPSNGSIIGVKTYLTIKGGASNAVPRSFETKIFGNMEWTTENIDLHEEEGDAQTYDTWEAISPNFFPRDQRGWYNYGDTARSFYQGDAEGIALNFSNWEVSSGWRIPSFQDWEALFATVGRSKAALEAAGFNPRGYGAYYTTNHWTTVRTDDGSEEWFAASPVGSNWPNACRIKPNSIDLIDKDSFTNYGIMDSPAYLPCRVIRMCRDL
jgi:hypothetical protein